MPSHPYPLLAPLVYFLLGLFGASRMFVGHLHLASYQIDNLSRDESIRDDQIVRIGEHLVGRHGEQVGRTRSGADQRDAAAADGMEFGRPGLAFGGGGPHCNFFFSSLLLLFLFLSFDVGKGADVVILVVQCR